MVRVCLFFREFGKEFKQGRAYALKLFFQGLDYDDFCDGDF